MIYSVDNRVPIPVTVYPNMFKTPQLTALLSSIPKEVVYHYLSTLGYLPIMFVRVSENIYIPYLPSLNLARSLEENPNLNLTIDTLCRLLREVNNLTIYNIATSILEHWIISPLSIKLTDLKHHVRKRLEAMLNLGNISLRISLPKTLDKLLNLPRNVLPYIKIILGNDDTYIPLLRDLFTYTWEPTVLTNLSPRIVLELNYESPRPIRSRTLLDHVLHRLAGEIGKLLYKRIIEHGIAQFLEELNNVTRPNVQIMATLSHLFESPYLDLLVNVSKNLSNLTLNINVNMTPGATTSIEAIFKPRHRKLLIIPLILARPRAEISRRWILQELITQLLGQEEAKLIEQLYNMLNRAQFSNPTRHPHIEIREKELTIHPTTAWIEIFLYTDRLRKLLEELLNIFNIDISRSMFNTKILTLVKLPIIETPNLELDKKMIILRGYEPSQILEQAQEVKQKYRL